MRHPYRVPEKRPKREHPPSSLVYQPFDEESGAKTGAKYVVGGALVAVLTNAVFGSILLAAAIVFVATVLGILRVRRGRTVISVITLRVEKKELIVFDERAIAPLHRVPLGRIEDVVLDTVNTQKLGMDVGALADVRGRAAIPMITPARILLVADGSLIPLTNERVAHIESTEWFGKIRTFLRGHGWLPEDEWPPEEEERVSANSSDTSSTM